MNQSDAVIGGGTNRGTLLRRSVASLIVAALVVALLRYPFAQIPLTLGLLLYGAILYLYPSIWLAVVPALLPVFDLAPWSGWFFFDELDFLVLLTLALGLWKSDVSLIETRPLPRLLSLAVMLLVLSYGVSLLLGLLPWDPLDANAFSNYYSRYNSLRMSKGFFEALGLFLLFLRQRHDETKAARKLIIGMVLGMAGTVIAVIWERFRFSGLWDFSSDFRVTATFSGMHNGGNDLEAYLVLAQPFIVAAMILQRHWITALGGIGLFLLSTYSLFVTYSRASLLAIAINGAFLVVGLAMSLRRWRGLRSPRALLIGTALATAVLLLVSSVVGGRYFQGRLDRAKRDWDYRVLQSRKTVAMMHPDWSTAWFGMGLGRYPVTAYQRNFLKNRPAAYRFESERENIFLRLFPGNRLYFGQWIGGIRPFEKYQLSFIARAHGQGALSAYLCEKTLQYSFRCANKSFPLAPVDAWVEQQAEIDSGWVGAKDEIGGWISIRPVEFALANGSKDGVFDVDNVRLLDSAGNNLLANGDFSGALNRWFFTVDDHTPWQNWNHWVHLYFEQGWLGVLAFLCFVTYLFCRLVKQIVDGNWLASIVLAAVSSFLAVGIFGFLFDTPRMALIYFLIAFIFGYGLSAPLGPAEPRSDS
jgi:O-antigen ligase/polysaccharide polymerase Wzy-like membrane protein